MEQQVQDMHPSQDYPEASDAPKVDVGDSGATLPTPEEAAEAVAVGAAHVEAVMAAADGFTGHNPDPTPNEEYTLAGVLNTAAIEGEVAPVKAELEELRSAYVELAAENASLREQVGASEAVATAAAAPVAPETASEQQAATEGGA